MKAFRIDWPGGPTYGATRTVAVILAKRLDGIIAPEMDDVHPDYVKHAHDLEDGPDFSGHGVPDWSIL